MRCLRFEIQTYIYFIMFISVELNLRESVVIGLRRRVLMVWGWFDSDSCFGFGFDFGIFGVGWWIFGWWVGGWFFAGSVVALSLPSFLVSDILAVQGLWSLVLSDLLRSAVFLAFDSSPSRRWFGVFLVFMFVGYFRIVRVVFVRIVCSLFLFDHRLGDKFWSLTHWTHPLIWVLTRSLLKRAFMLVVGSGELLTLEFCTVLAVGPFAIITL